MKTYCIILARILSLISSGSCPTIMQIRHAFKEITVSRNIFISHPIILQYLEKCKVMFYFIKKKYY